MRNQTIVDFSVLQGKTMRSVVQSVVSHRTGDQDAITFTTVEGEVYTLTHDQDCCEVVEVEDICGRLEALVGSPLLVAEEYTQDGVPGVPDSDVKRPSTTWTFYKLATRKGHVTIRWIGRSNGYYSEKVTLYQEVGVETI